jgi:phosphopantothenoylcysteine decarboxylase/phosphopantothenate--cysteine ligase
MLDTFPSLKGCDIVVGITGGIAAYKSADLVSRLKKAGADVYVIMTRNALEFISPLTFETLSGHPVASDMFKRFNTWDVEHITLAKRAGLLVVAPATANIIAKLANGIADDMLSTTALATKAPLIIAPAMNEGMWTADATCENVSKLRSRGVYFIGPDNGSLACGDIGSGRMAEPLAIMREIYQIAHHPQRDLLGIKVLVTAGPTREHIDPIRYISNASSGKMGYAIASVAVLRGAEVTLVTGPVQAPVPEGIRTLHMESTEDLYRIMLKEAQLADVIVQAAAPADFSVASVEADKIKRKPGEQLTLQLTKTHDVAKSIGAMKRHNQVLVGFAAETQNLHDNARQKLTIKNLDMIIANDVTVSGAGFSEDTNKATLITIDTLEERPLEHKTVLANAILDKAAAILTQKTRANAD